MLVITRNTDEAENKIVIGDPKKPIGTITIRSVKGERVRVACDFPKDVQVNRGEIAALRAAQKDAGAA
jgi:sRNA-binding carbon storage regulator CsrA